MSEPQTIVVPVLAAQEELATRIADAVDGWLRLPRQDFENIVDFLVQSFRGGHPIIIVGSAGIAVRSLAPVLTEKQRDAPVVVVSPDGAFSIPLLGGHHGANALARKIAQVIGCQAAVSTAGDIHLGVSLDEPPKGWVLENPEEAKSVMAMLLKGNLATVSGDAPWLSPLDARVIANGRGSPVVLSVEGAEPLIYRRQRFVVGVGAARGCAEEEMVGLVMRELADAGIAPGEVAAVHSIDLKSDEAAVHAVAEHLGVKARFHSAARLENERPRMANPSEIVFAEVGCHGVAEGAALAAAGPDGQLISHKTKSANATCAIAEVCEGGAVGKARGHLAVVGIGPGQEAWRTGEAARLIAEADELVGYGLYLDLLGSSIRGKRRRDFDLGEEEERCRYALESAGEGKRVALVSSGDAGIFAMGALVMELLGREGPAGVSASAKRAEIIHAPGISALQAASARTGAILGHDFCAISLSDLLTPRETIKRRVKAAAEGDFAIAFYNPVSRRRRTLLAEARELLLRHRPPNCPVILASNLGRPGEKLLLRELADLDVNEVDMLTIVIVGASSSRVIKSGDRSAGAEGNWVYTPRGYAKKLEGALS